MLRSAVLRDSRIFGVGAGAALGLLLGAVAVFAAAASPAAGMMMIVGIVVPAAAVALKLSQRVLLALVILDVPLQWDFNLSYHQAAAKLGALGGLDISLTTMALAALYGAWIAEALARHPTDRLRLRPAAPLLVYIGFLILSLAVSHNRTLSSFEIALLIQVTMLFVYLTCRLRRSDIAFVTTTLAAGLLIESLVMLAQRYAGFELDIGGLSTRQLQVAGSENLSRIGGTVGSPNSAGGYIALTLMPVFVLLVMPGSRARKVVAAAASIVAPIALILTFSRGGWLSLVVSLVALLTLGVRRASVPARAPVIATVVLVAAAAIFHGAISHRLNGNDNNAAASRVPLMRLAGDMIQRHPLTGIGANTFAIRIPDFAGPEFSSSWLYTVHNKYLLVWAEAGVGAFAAFMWFLVATIRSGLRASRRVDRELALLAAALTAAVVGQMADMLVEPYHSRAEIQGLVVAAALITACARLSCQPHPSGLESRDPGLVEDVGYATLSTRANTSSASTGGRVKPRKMPSRMNPRFTRL
jgi:O-antigen ligase